MPSADLPTSLEVGAPAQRATPASARRAALAAGAAVVSLAVSTVVPLLGPLLIALVVGAVLANVPLTTRSVQGSAPRVDRWLLRSGVVLLGLKVSVEDIWDLGVAGIVVVLATVAVTYAATYRLGPLLGVDRELTTLIAAGFSICGAAAIAAVEDAIRARPQDVALAISLVTVCGTAMIAVVPTVGHAVLTDQQTALWTGASIHEVAQVIAAASLVGAGGGAVLATAIAVKLARVILLVPVQVTSARLCRTDSERRGPIVPLFLVGFLAAVALRSTGLLPEGVLRLSGAATTLLLSAAMFGLGTGIVLRRLWPLSPRVLVLALCSTSVAATTSFGLIWLLT